MLPSSDKNISEFDGKNETLQQAMLYWWIPWIISTEKVPSSSHHRTKSIKTNVILKEYLGFMRCPWEPRTPRIILIHEITRIFQKI